MSGPVRGGVALTCGLFDGQVGIGFWEEGGWGGHQDPVFPTLPAGGGVCPCCPLRLAGSRTIGCCPAFGRVPPGALGAFPMIGGG